MFCNRTENSYFPLFSQQEKIGFRNFLPQFSDINVMLRPQSPMSIVCFLLSWYLKQECMCV